jgi:hypothetical protein
MVVALGRSMTPHTLAAAVTPPAPPTFVPTPIGAPPGPPTPRASVSATAGPSATVTPGTTPTAVAGSSFHLDAVRLSLPNNKGDLSGLAAVKRGATVWLMMYFTVKHLPAKVRRLTTYQINYAGKPVYKVTYRESVKGPYVGRFSRYSVYSIPSSLSYGSYVYRATLAFGKGAQTKSWKFQIGKQNRVAASGRP